jgi:molybdate transport system substrate-binding protein
MRQKTPMENKARRRLGHACCTVWSAQRGRFSGAERVLRAHSHDVAATTLLSAVLAVAACTAGPNEMGASPIRVAAAADLALAFDEIGRVFSEERKAKVVFTFGSTGLLAKLVEAGAPFDVFAAANVTYVDDVISAGSCDATTKEAYARGRIVMWSKAGGVLPPRSLGDLSDVRFTRIAIANPEHAPYGLAAKEALLATGVWPSVEGRLVFGENVRQTLQFAESGNVEVSLVALPLVSRDRQSPWTLVDEALHRPIEQALVVCTRGANQAGGAAFARFVGSPRGRTILADHGFTTTPDDVRVQNP